MAAINNNNICNLGGLDGIVDRASYQPRSLKMIASIDAQFAYANWSGKKELEDNKCMLDHVLKSGLIDSTYVKYLYGILSGTVDLDDIDDRYKSHELYYEAVASTTTKYYLPKVPRKFRSLKMCRKAVEATGDIYPNVISFVPEEYLDDDLIATAVKLNGSALYHVNPLEKRTYRICKLAVTQRGSTLQNVPDNVKSRLICWIAVANCPDALQFVPKRFRSNALYELAVSAKGSALKFVPRSKRTLRICTIAVRSEGAALRYVPTPLKTMYLSTIAVESDGMALRFVKKKYITYEMCKVAVANNPGAIVYVPGDDEMNLSERGVNAGRSSDLCVLADFARQISTDDVDFILRSLF